MIVAVDVDGVVADLHTEWNSRANGRFGLSLGYTDFTDWNAYKKLIPERHWLEYFAILSEPDLYDNVSVVEGAKEGVEALRNEGNRVVFLSAAMVGAYDQKARWLIRNGFLPDSKRESQDLLFCADKSLVRAQALIDDGPHNLEAFGGMSIAFDTPWNRGDYKRRVERLQGWAKLPDLWRKIYG